MAKWMSARRVSPVRSSPPPPPSQKELDMDKSQEAPHKKHIPKTPPSPPKPQKAETRGLHRENSLWERRFELRHRVLTNLLYQQERRRILETRDKSTKLIALLASSVVFAQLAPLADYFSLFAAIACAGGMASLAFGFAERAQNAATRQMQWEELNRQVESTHWQRVNGAALDDWFSRACAIEAGEPAPNPVVLSDCANRAGWVLNSSEARGRALRFWPALLRFVP